MLATIAVAAGRHDVLDRVLSASAQRDSVVGFDGAGVITAVGTPAVVRLEERQPVLDADEFTAGGSPAAMIT